MTSDGDTTRSGQGLSEPRSRTASSLGVSRRTFRTMWRSLGSDRGMAATELAIIFPLLIGTLLIIFQSAFYWHAWNVANLAAEQGVAAGQVDGASSADATAGAANIIAQTGGLAPGSVTSVVYGVDPAGGPRVQVTVTAEPLKILPVNWPVVASAEGRVEEFIGADQR